MTAAEPVTLQVNGARHEVVCDPDTPLLYVLRNDLGLVGAKFGCGLGLCGACNVLVDGALAVGTVVHVTLSADHRVIDGALAADWMTAFVAAVEEPLRLLV